MTTQRSFSQITLHRLRLIASNAYLLVGDGAILIDSGFRGEGKRILEALRIMGIASHDLRLILLTHGHFDHAGGAQEVAAKTGAPIILHAEDACWISSGQEAPTPPVTLWARAIARLLSVRFIQTRMKIPPFNPDIVLGEADFSLEEYGIPAIVIHTPGHTAGSMSVLLEDGRVVVGDLAMNGFPSLKLKPNLPIAAQNLFELGQSWQKLFNRGVTTVYPGHGSPFSYTLLKMKV